MTEADEKPLISTPEQCVEFVNQVQICTWRQNARFKWMPSLEMATPWRGMQLTYETWFWKDDLHISRSLYFGMLIAPDTPVFVSRRLLPALIAAQGDIDAENLHETGLLASNAIRVYRHIEQHGPTATAALPWQQGSRMLYLATLQQKFLLTKYDLTGRTRGKYGYRWCLCEDAFAESFEQAQRLRVLEAREQVTRVFANYNPEITVDIVRKMLRWPTEG